MALPEQPNTSARHPNDIELTSPTTAISRPGPHPAVPGLLHSQRKEHDMFCIFKLLDKARKAAIRKAKLLADRALDGLQRAWRRHARRVATDPAYAAAAAVVLGACLGFSPVRDAVAAVLAWLVGVRLNGRRTAYDRYGSGVSRWNANEWDIDDG
jgi:hypothetical protein